jgi:hypothetical protein
MKLPNPFTRGDTASLLQKEIAAEAAATAKLVDMRAARARDLLEADDLAVIEKHDTGIAALERQISIHQDRILALDARLAKEVEQQRLRDYEAAVASIERLLPLRADAAAEVQSAILALSSAVQKFVQVSGSIVNQWPADRLGTKPSWQLGTRAIGELMRNCWANAVMVYSTTKQSPPAGDYVRRACDAHERAAGFADATRSDHAELIAGLRAHGAPAVEIDEEVVAA